MAAAPDPIASPRYLSSTEQAMHLFNDLQHSVDAHHQLMQAVERKSLKDIRAHLDQAGTLDKAGWSALGLAAKMRYDEGVRELAPLEKQLHMDVRLKMGSMTVTRPTALILAAYYNYQSIIEILLDFESGATDGEGRVALVHASAMGNLEAVKLLAPREGDLYAEDALKVCCSEAKSSPHKSKIEELLRSYIM
ncbi:Ankyrin repeat protein 1 [Giardia duodenalis]|uniref:Ankyrin repeat protein 1 n=2 Tax=Giardia intestinalis TaxID=5741 RepID=A8BX32_GIAIC|nr:Ankyrin repeat protein 1 [Giardia intestinalis]ESU34960.1 Hypothetical protein DHA2_16156 [Giardia intestinalis]KAE8303259.1 Ankyrin repeat protein 1 [Giardia intestinalis]|eukprot:XP_001704361.1 Hypothetical protein GL50803_16156 [Giardia lamblia ATCC 50803]